MFKLISTLFFVPLEPAFLAGSFHNNLMNEPFVPNNVRLVGESHFAPGNVTRERPNFLMNELDVLLHPRLSRKGFPANIACKRSQLLMERYLVMS